MNGNYQEKIKNKNKITFADIEDFVYFLLQDVCEGSSDTILNSKTKVTYSGDANLSELAKTKDTKVLISFKLNKNDPRNLNFVQTLKDNGDIMKPVYEIVLVTEKDDSATSTGGTIGLSQTDFLRVAQTVIDGMTNNANSTVKSSENYILLIPRSEATLTSPLTLNEADPLPDLEVQESTPELNYLTVSTNIVFTINKLS
jgi:hypothetical protein